MHKCQSRVSLQFGKHLSILPACFAFYNMLECIVLVLAIAEAKINADLLLCVISILQPLPWWINFSYCFSCWTRATEPRLRLRVLVFQELQIQSAVSNQKRDFKNSYDNDEPHLLTHTAPGSHPFFPCRIIIMHRIRKFNVDSSLLVLNVVFAVSHTARILGYRTG